MPFLMVGQGALAARLVLLCLWLGLAGVSPAQVLPLPPRSADAPDGDAFAQQVAALDLGPRDQAVAREFLAGNAPDFLRKFCPITVTQIAGGVTNVATFFVAPDYVAIGSDTNYFLAPVAPDTAQVIADRLECVLPTRKMVDAIYAAAEVKLPPAPIPPSPAMTTLAVFAQHNQTVRTQRLAFAGSHPLGALVAGHKKDVVLSARLAGVTNKVAIYGWHQTNGVAIQPLYLGHIRSWVDYSQCVRLVRQSLLVNGQKKTVAEVLADPGLCDLLSDEGVITPARYTTNAVAPAMDEKLTLPWPARFSARPHADEWEREIRLPDEVRIRINAPAPESTRPNQPLLLVFYALPNGNSIEQTIGKPLQPGDDWHFDIQHIGAQIRWLRQAVTNQTIVVAYLEAETRSWPAWRKQHSDRRIVEILDGVLGIFAARAPTVALAGHSGGGSLIFGYLNAVDAIPGDVRRLALLDCDYAYDTARHAEKLNRWLEASAEHRLCVLAYQDYLARLDGKPFVSEAGGTWGRSQAMRDDLRGRFEFLSQTNAGLETFATPDRQVEFLLKENPEGKILHTVQVERNGLIQALLSGTPAEGQGYEYLGGRVYTNCIE